MNITFPNPVFRAELIKKVDQVADAARLKIVGEAARMEEYKVAKEQAEAYRDAGFTGPVPPSVQAEVDAKELLGMTPKQAAEDILAASVLWYAALEGIRALRLKAKEQIRVSNMSAEAENIYNTFVATITASIEGIG